MIDETTAKRRQPGELLTKNDAMRYARARTVKIPQTCKEIEEEAFLSNGKMITLLLPNGLEQIGNNAFRRNRLLREVALPHSICKVGSGCFSECEVLEAAYLSKQLKVIPENMFRSDRHLKKVLFTKDSQLETIEGFAFYDCNALEVILLPAGVQEIGDKAFYRCKNLKTVRFPKGLKRIGREAFNFCKVQQLDLPDTLEEIDKKAFFCCKELTKVVIPESVRKIGAEAFHGIAKLEVIEIWHDPEEIGENIANKPVRIRCYQGSKVDAYCQEYGYTVEYIEKQ